MNYFWLTLLIINGLVSLLAIPVAIIGLALILLGGL